MSAQNRASSNKLPQAGRPGPATPAEVAAAAAARGWEIQNSETFAGSWTSSAATWLREDLEEFGDSRNLRGAPAVAAFAANPFAAMATP